VRLDRTRIAICERSQPEILDLSLLVLRTFFVPVIGLVCVLALPLAIVNFWAIQWMAADLSEGRAIARYLWTMGQLVYVEAPLAGVLATAYLGKVTFHEEPTFRSLVADVFSLGLRLLWTQGVLRGVILVLWMVIVMPMEDVVTGTETVLTLVCFVLFVCRSFRPYINEIVLLERSPLWSRNKEVISVATRSSRLHGPNAGDLFGRGIALAPVTLSLGAGLVGSLWFIFATFTNHWGWGTVMIHIITPAVFWMLVVYTTVVRFLSYLDLRIRREGWEVELQMRAEANRLRAGIVSG
jgi:hypothetical protein